MDFDAPIRPRNLASDYLHQATEALHNACNPAYLYAQWRPNMVRSGMGQFWMRRWAQETRFRESRTCALFAALASEAYVNEFLSALTSSRSQFKKLDEYSPVKKYTDAVAQVSGTAMFNEGDALVPTLGKLFKLRNRLAHPKPGFGTPQQLAEPFDEKIEALFPTNDLADYVVTVAGAASTLVARAYGPEAIDVPAGMIWHARGAVYDFATRFAELPAPDAPDEPSIWNVIGDDLNPRTPN